MPPEIEAAYVARRGAAKARSRQHASAGAASAAGKSSSTVRVWVPVCVQLELELRHYAEVAAPSAQAPEQLRVLRRAKRAQPRRQR